MIRVIAHAYAQSRTAPQQRHQRHWVPPPLAEPQVMQECQCKQNTCSSGQTSTHGEKGTSNGNRDRAGGRMPWNTRQRGKREQEAIRGLWLWGPEAVVGSWGAKLWTSSLFVVVRTSIVSSSGTHEDPTVAAFLNFRNPVTCGSKLTIS